MLRDLVSISARTAIATSYITLSGYSNNNRMLLQSSQSITSPSSAPSVYMQDIYRLAENRMVLCQYVYNQTNRDVSLILRTGVRQIVPPTPGHYSGTVIIRNVYIIHKSNTPTLDKFYYDSLKDSHQENQELVYVRDQYLEFRKASQPDHMCVMIDAVVDGTLLEEHRSLYVHNRDMVLSIEAVDVAPHHPFDALESSKERNEQLLKDHIGAGVVVEFIDNSGGTQERYFHVGKQIYSVRSRRDPTRADGIYVFKTYVDAGGQRHTLSNYYELNKAEEELGLYTSFEMAVSGGDIKTLREQELEKRKHENRLLQTELEQLKSHSEQELLAIKLDNTRQEVNFKERVNQLDQSLKESEHARKMAQERWDLEKLDMQRRLEYDRNRYANQDMERKDYYENRSHVRKDFTEGLKLWPVLLTAAVGAIAYVTKK